MSAPDAIIPILLAAGASSRMGRPKALLDFDGKTALELALDAVRGYGRPIVVLGPHHLDVRKRVNLDGANLAYNLEVESGQTASLRAALAILPPGAEAFFFMPADHPLLGPAEIARLVEASADPGASIFIPSHGMKRGHPVLCRRELAAEFLSLAPGEPARAVIRRNETRIRHVEYSEAYVLMDMDTPEDYLRCLDAWRTRRRGEAT